MRTLIRFITRTAADSVEEHDKIIDADAITIGRATDQILHIRDRRARLEHARIEPAGNRMRIVSNALAGVTINGRSQREATLETGDEIEIGANVLTVVEPPEGADFALTFKLSPDASEADLAQGWTTATEGIAGLSKRQLAWGLTAIVLVVAFLVPALTMLHPAVADFLRSSALLPDDGAWLAGPVHAAHATTAAECENCHTDPFRRVPDEACAACHTVGRHVEEEAHAVLGDRRCASCHLEHNEPPELVSRRQALCADCHRQPPEDVDLAPAADFAAAHPPFRASLAVPAGDEWRIERLPLTEASGNERSNLRFDHAAHLDPDGIVTPDGTRVIDCEECHQPETGGRGMREISMDEHCSGCHTLAFDPDDPSRVVPHGDPPAVVQTLIEYYSARLLGEDAAAPDQRVRRPGETISRAERDRRAAEARERALAVAADLFERRTCATCHEVLRTDDGELPWRVVPVRLTDRYFPLANFSHAAHDTEVTDCSGCHEAATSTTASDLLIPGIDNCRECHGSGNARRNADGQLPSSCIVCHGFHVEDRGEYP